MTKELYFVDTSVSVKYNKTLKALLLCLYKYTALDESLVTNIALRFAFCNNCHSTLISSIQNGGSALSNTYSTYIFVHQDSW